jgi:hypothetical protein
MRRLEAAVTLYRMTFNKHSEELEISDSIKIIKNYENKRL